MNPIERRDFLKGTATGLLAFTVGVVEVWLSPRGARAQGVPFRLLKADEAQTIEALAETLVPGARAAGIAHFVDQQLSVRRKKHCSRRASSMFARPMPTSIALQSYFAGPARADLSGRQLNSGEPRATRHAAVDHQLRAGQVAGRVGGEE